MSETPSPFLAVMEMIDGLAPVFDAAKAIRSQLESEGFSPSAAEVVATEFLTGCMRKAFA
jgi:hypothetical protein